MTSSTTDKARQVRLLIVDIDGVLTDGGLHFDNRGEEYKTFNSLDGHGLRMLLDSGIEVAVITGRQSEIVNHRMGDLGVKHIYQGNRDKLPALETLLQGWGLTNRFERLSRGIDAGLFRPDFDRVTSKNDPVLLKILMMANRKLM